MYPLTLALLSFAAPALLAGAALVALPLLAHWMHRKVRTRIVFPSLKLLRDAAIQRQQLGSWRRWLLFLLRATAVLLIALAFAQPYLQRVKAPPGESSAGVTLVLLDTSASLGRQINGIPLFQNARAAVGDVLDAAARRGDRVQVLRVDGSPGPVYPDFTLNSAGLRGEIAELEPGYTRADWPAALAQAESLLLPEKGSRNLVIISDFQASNWLEISQGQGQWGNLTGVEVLLVNLPSAAPTNLSLGGPTCYPPYPSAGQAVRLGVRVVNQSAAPHPAEVKCLVAGELVDSQSVDLAPYEARDLIFNHTFAEIGAARVEFTLPPDDLVADNHAYLTCRTEARPVIAVVSDQDPDAPGTAAFYITRALSPRNNERDPFAARILRGSEVSPATLTGVRAAWVVDAPSLDATSVSALHAKVDEGGAVILMLDGPGGVKEAAALDPPGAKESWLPFAVQSAEATTDASPFWLRDSPQLSQLLPDFDISNRDALARVPMYHRELAGRAHPESQQTLHFRDGQPALAFRDFGSGGRLIEAAFSPAREAGTLGATAVWVAFCQELIDSLPSPGKSGTPPVVGNGLLIVAGLGEHKGIPSLTSPEGKVLSAASFQLENTTISASLPTTAEPGFYSLRLENTDVAQEAVNLDPRESDLRPADTQALLTHFRLPTGASPKEVSAGELAGMIPDNTFPLWGWVLALGALALAAESALLTKWKH